MFSHFQNATFVVHLTYRDSFGISAFIPFHECLTFCKYGRVLTKINDKGLFHVKKFTDDNSNHPNCKFMEINNACGFSYICKELLWVVEYFYFYSLFLIISFSTMQNSFLQIIITHYSYFYIWLRT